MRFERKHKNIIIIGIAVFFILYGFLDMKFNFNISADIEDKVTWVLTIIAVALLFSGTKPKLKNSDSSDTSIQDNIADDAENSNAKRKTITAENSDAERKTITTENSTEADINDGNRED